MYVTSHILLRPYATSLFSQYIFTAKNHLHNTFTSCLRKFSPTSFPWQTNPSCWRKSNIANSARSLADVSHYVRIYYMETFHSTLTSTVYTFTLCISTFVFSSFVYMFDCVSFLPRTLFFKDIGPKQNCFFLNLLQCCNHNVVNFISSKTPSLPLVQFITKYGWVSIWFPGFIYLPE